MNKRFTLGCINTKGWKNGEGHDCSSYEKMWCFNGGAKVDSEWSLGAAYNYPEENCCACGKKSRGITLDVNSFYFCLETSILI